MPPVSVFSSSFLLLMFSIGQITFPGKNHPSIQEKENTQQWRSLFNGKDLSGWHT
ncbi:MAG: hypothetical protein IM577_03200, partial [Chitinophagaceae bacterium]|nr:hypothetical protein [Chitinophagaceae bacterium]